MAVALLEVTGGGDLMNSIMRSLAAEVGYDGALPTRTQAMLWKAQGVQPHPAQREFAELLLRAAYTAVAYRNFELASEKFQKKLENADSEKLFNITGAVMASQRPIHDLIAASAPAKKRARGAPLQFSKSAKDRKAQWGEAKVVDSGSV